MGDENNAVFYIFFGKLRSLLRVDLQNKVDVSLAAIYFTPWFYGSREMYHFGVASLNIVVLFSYET